MSGNAASQISKFGTTNSVKIKDESRGNYNSNIDIKSKTLMLKSSLFDYSDAYMSAEGTIPEENTVKK